MKPFQQQVEAALLKWLPAGDTMPNRLHQAMRYAVLANGKRLRPALVYTTGAVLGVDGDCLDGPACAVELVHAYSLVHDDLPAMDDDDLRRGQPTCHIQFDEATAVLTGDALQSLAFEVLAEDPSMMCSPEKRLHMIKVLADAIGSKGMAGGQALDLEAEGKSLGLHELEAIHQRKTGRLITASILLGALSKDSVEAETLASLEKFGHYIGLAFQIRDDILDVEGDTAVMGKTQGADMDRNKQTYPAVVGMEQAKQKAAECYETAIGHLHKLGKAADPLRALSDFIIDRKH